MIALTSVGARIGPIQILTDITLSAPRGRFVTIIGAHGAGKTTLLRTISNLLFASEGRVVFAGRDTRGIAPHRLSRSGLVHVPQRRPTARSHGPQVVVRCTSLRREDRWPRKIASGFQAGKILDDEPSALRDRLRTLDERFKGNGYGRGSLLMTLSAGGVLRSPGTSRCARPPIAVETLAGLASECACVPGLA